jgi:hypothetical protein
MVSCGAGTTYPTWWPEFTSGFLWASCCSIGSFVLLFCRSLFVLLPGFVWYCLSLDLWLLFNSVVSSNCSSSSQSVTITNVFVTQLQSCTSMKQHKHPYNYFTTNTLQNIYIFDILLYITHGNVWRSNLCLMI